MDNLLSLIRRQNIFGRMNNNDDSMMTDPEVSGNIDFGANSFNPRFTGSVVDDNNDNYDVNSRMHELYQPEHQFSDKYASALDSMPVRQDPNIWRKMLAGVTSFAGDPRLTEHALYAPHEREMSDWGTKIKSLEPAAQLERQNNSNMRSVANSIISQEQGSRRLERQYARDSTIARQGDERLAQGNERLKQGDQRVAQGEARLKIANEVAKGGQFKVDDNGNAMIIHKDGSTIPVDASFLTFEEKEKLKAQTAGARAAAVAANQKPRLQIRESTDPKTGDIQRVVVNLDTGEETPVTSAQTKSSNPIAQPKQTQTEQGKSVVNAAQEIKNSNPRWNKYITIKNGQVAITTPGIFSGPSKEEYNQMNQAIFGTRSRGGAPTTQTPSTNTNTNTGMIRVIGPNGETGSMPATSALLPGWRKQ